MRSYFLFLGNETEKFVTATGLVNVQPTTCVILLSTSAYRAQSCVVPFQYTIKTKAPPTLSRHPALNGVQVSFILCFAQQRDVYTCTGIFQITYFRPLHHLQRQKNWLRARTRQLCVSATRSCSGTSSSSSASPLRCSSKPSSSSFGQWGPVCGATSGNPTLRSESRNHRTKQQPTNCFQQPPMADIKSLLVSQQFIFHFLLHFNS